MLIWNIQLLVTWIFILFEQFNSIFGLPLIIAFTCFTFKKIICYHRGNIYTSWECRCVCDLEDKFYFEFRNFNPFEMYSSQNVYIYFKFKHEILWMVSFLNVSYLFVRDAEFSLFQPFLVGFFTNQIGFHLDSLADVRVLSLFFVSHTIYIDLSIWKKSL